MRKILLAVLLPALLIGAVPVALAQVRPAVEAAPPTDPPAEVGINLGHFDTRDAAAFERDVAVRLDGVDALFGPAVSPYVRIELKWHAIQPARGAPIFWDHADRQVDQALARGMRVLLILAYAPHWASGNPDRVTWFPREDADWRSLVEQTIAHFGSRVQAYEVWNEPNMVDTFGSFEGKEPIQRYWELVRIAHQRIHAACATCTVVAGGSARGEPRDGRTNTPSEWLRYAYANGYGGDFDALAHHPYSFTWDGPAAPDCVAGPLNVFGPLDLTTLCGELTRVRRIMLDHGDSAKKIWATEIGYPAAAGSPLVAQARNHLLHALRMWRMLSYAGPFMLYTFQDDCADSSQTACVFGVVDRNYQPKQPLYADLSVALGRRAVVGTGDAFATGDTALRSANGRYTLRFWHNGSLMVLRDNSAVVWRSTGTGGVRLLNQDDGNLVLYAADGSAVWSSNTFGQGPSQLVLQDDGNLVLRRNPSLQVTWASGTATLRSTQQLSPGDSAIYSPNRRFWLTLQPDGNLVLYRSDGVARWATGTSGIPGNEEVPPDRVFVLRLANQSDGNLVLYRRNGRAAWSTGTWTAGPSTLLVQDDGNVVLRRDRDGAIVWTAV